MRDFQRDGFVVLSGFLDADDLAAVSRLVDERVEAPHESGCERPHNTLAPLRWNDTLVQLALSTRRQIDALAHAVGARDLRWISAYVSSKPARSGPLWWHQDWWCWQHPVSLRREAAQVAALCYLAGVDETNGALRLLPGSHHRSHRLHAALPSAHSPQADTLESDHPAMRDAPDQVTPAVAAGDAVVVDYRLLHGTHANNSETRRDCLLLSFAPSWSELPDEIQAHLISHPAQPRLDEAPPAWQSDLLPSYCGRPRDLPVDRNPPARFAVPA